MHPWIKFAIDLIGLWQTQAAAAVVVVVLTNVLAAHRWLRRRHAQTLILLRAVGIHMLQNRPPTDDVRRLAENRDWWDSEVLKVLPKAGATPGEVAGFGDLGNMSHGSIVAEKIARLGKIIDRIEGR